jgi:hypothetical protein
MRKVVEFTNGASAEERERRRLAYEQHEREFMEMVVAKLEARAAKKGAIVLTRYTAGGINMRAVVEYEDERTERWWFDRSRNNWVRS